MTRTQEINCILKLIANYGFHGIIKDEKVYIRGNKKDISSIKEALRAVQN